MSEARSGSKHHNFGKHLPESTRMKIAAALKGKPGTMLGRKHSAETKAKMAASAKRRVAVLKQA